MAYLSDFCSTNTLEPVGVLVITNNLGVPIDVQ
jgi:hypothetical protein